ncbi:hypothetical protein C8C83_2842 [Flavobacterium sp. 90]|nr:hypothetical protein C8C82_3152 [Flavobacterium sp. 81]TCK54926.1 hypothetical protein C8C83_2842 [Flavobacterium sp. 90]
MFIGVCILVSFNHFKYKILFTNNYGTKNNKEN